MLTVATPVNVLSYHNDHSSTGQNLLETTLSPASVNSTQFGKQLTTPVDGQVYAQPLYVSGVNITAGPAPGVHNVVYVVTQHDSLYAIDADSGAVLWHDSFINPAAGVTTVPGSDVKSTDITPEIGITSTPVIDANSGILYLTAKTKEVSGGQSHYVYRLHAINIVSGAEALGGPAVIGDTIAVNAGGSSSTYTYISGPSVAGSGGGSVNGVISFNALRELNRPGLTLANGSVYIAFSSHGDNPPYHGWVLSYNAQTLQLNGVFNATPNGSQGGIWQSGDPVTVDAQGSIYFQTGNGDFDTTMNAAGLPNRGDYGDSLVKLVVDASSTAAHPNINGWGLKVADYFTPFNQATFNQTDKDLGSGGPLLLPDSAGSAAHPHLLIAGGKEGRIYLIDRDNLGKFNANTDQVVQEQLGAVGGIFDTPSYFNNGTTQQIYFGTNSSTLRAFTIASGGFSAAAVSHSADTFAFPGPTASISANGAGGAVAWAIDHGTSQLRAYDANNLAVELYTSAQAAGSRDALGTSIKFAVPTVAAGRVYVGTSNSLLIYGEFSPPNDPTNLAGARLSTSRIRLTWTRNSSNDTGFTIERSTDGMAFSPVGTAVAGATSFVDSNNVQPSTNYYYRIKAFNANGNSGYSNVAGPIQPDTTAPSSTVSPLPQFETSATFNVSWSGADDTNGSGIATYNVYVSDNGGAFALFQSGVTQTSAAFTGVDGHVYGFYSVATDNSGNVQATPGAAQAMTTVKLPANQSVNLAAAFNRLGIATDGSTFTGGADGKGAALSANLLGPSLTLGSVNYTIGAAGRANVVQAQGQTLALPAGSFSTLNMLAIGVNGNQAQQTFVVHYTDGSSQTIVQSVSDWFTSQNYAGETTALTMAYRDGGNGGRDSRTFHVYAYSFALNSSKAISSVTLPNNGNVDIIAMTAVGGQTGGTTTVAPPTNLIATATTAHVNLSWTAATGAVTGYNVYRGATSGGESGTPLNPVALSAGTTTYQDTAVAPGGTYYYVVQAINGALASPNSNQAQATVTVTSTGTKQVNLAAAFNRVGIATDGATFTGGADGKGAALSANLLGTSLTTGSVSYSIGAAGGPNVVLAQGQSLALPTGSFSTLNLLAIGVNGNQARQSFVVRYTDGSSQTILQSISDWFTLQNYPGETTALTMAYRDGGAGSRDSRTFRVYSYSFALNVSKVVASVTLPNNANLDILAITAGS